ncbi:hypothetical protein GYMLUDRAFT_237048 [Collybiopsis luxurians FD-317 M1]|nr:hypothetical protein GYMLUDRAFT_237048 [Collybiopsis luxurians FD-317 M1]
MVEIRPLSPVEEEEDLGEADPPIADAEEEFSPQYASGINLAFIVLGLCLTVFVIHLDANIIATAIPRITSTFDSLDDIGWYGSAYLLTSTTLQPCFGRLYTHFDLKIIYLSSLLIFEAGSILCATATSSSMFIAGRAVAGIGVAALLSGSMSILVFSIGLEKRPLYIAVLASMYAISAVVGPVLGGVLTDRLTWRWCFWINLFCGAPAFFTTAYFFRSPRRESSSVRPLWRQLNEIDFLGAALFVSSSISLMLALQWGGTLYAWRNARIWGLFVVSVLLFIAFIIWQKLRKETALLPLNLLFQRSVLVSTAISFFYSMMLAVYVFYLPVYFQAVKHTTAEGSAIRILPWMLSLTLTAGLAGAVITSTGEYVPIMWLGSSIMLVGCGMLSTLDVDSALSSWLGYQLVLGVGTGLAAQIPFLAVQVIAKPSEIPLALSLLMLANSAGGAVAISIAQSLFLNALEIDVERYDPGLDPSTIIEGGLINMSVAGASAENLSSITEAFARALRTTFISPVVFSGICAFAGLALERRNIKGKSMMSMGSA